MASRQFRILDGTPLAASDTCPRDKVVDAGAYNTLQVFLNVGSAGGTNATLVLQHASINEPAMYMDLLAFDISAAGKQFETISNFLRYLRWITNGAVTGSPCTIMDIVAKE